MCLDHRSAQATRASQKALGASALEQGPRGRIEFSNEDSSTFHVHAYARTKSAPRHAAPVRSSTRSTGPSAHAS